MEIFSINWHRYNDSKNYIIGYLIYNTYWYFKYNDKDINDAIKEGFRPFPDLPNIDEVYKQPYLFQTFYSRYKVHDRINEIMKQQDGELITDKILIKYMGNKHGEKV